MTRGWAEGKQSVENGFPPTRIIRGLSLAKVHPSACDGDTQMSVFSGIFKATEILELSV